jgi:hypothetical protein
MDISPKQSRNISAFFTILFAVNVGYTIWNFHEQRKLRKQQQKIIDEQLIAIEKSKINQEQKV